MTAALHFDTFVRLGRLGPARIPRLFRFLVRGLCTAVLVLAWTLGVEASPANASPETRSPGDCAGASYDEVLDLVRTSDAKASARAAKAFLDLVACLGTDAGSSGGDRLLLHSYFLYPDALRREVLAVRPESAAATAPDDPDAVQARRDAGDRLLRWWRRQDPVPATAHNERVEEHLRRVVYALDAFSASTATGLSPRGVVYVRYGAPTEKIEIDFRDHPRLNRLFRTIPELHAGDFPDNEVWHYTFHPQAHYVFVERGGVYRIGTTMDLLPSSLVNTAAASALQHRTQFAALAMRWMFKELYHVHPRFRTQLLRLDANVDPYVQPRNARPVWAYLRTAATETNRAEADIARKRRRTMPAQRTQVRADLPVLPVAVRTARFLEDDGSTRTELYWGLLPGAASLPDDARKKGRASRFSLSDPRLLQMAVVQRDDDYERRDGASRRYLVSPSDDQGIASRPGTYVVSGDSGRYHLSLQVDEVLAEIEDGMLREVGPTLRSTQHTIDSLQALPATSSKVVMSDLRPLRVVDPANPLDSTDVHPFTEYRTDVPLLLRFEVYHLARRADGTTRYSVDYRVETRTDERGLQRLFGTDDGQTTTTSTTVEGTTRRTEEAILIEFSDWQADQPQRAVVTVQVTDDVGGHTAERSLELVLLPPPPDS